MPLKPIINSIFSITSGAEKYILNIINPLVKKCEFSVSSTIIFKEKFQKISPKFSNFHEVVSFDAKSLFTSINVPRVVDYIIDEIYKEPDIYFSENDQENFPPKLLFKEFLMGVLLKFSAFWCINGYYRQKAGLSMGSKLSPAISNIFLHMMENIVIKQFMDQNILLFYCRYVDDCLLIVRKRYKNLILNKMNNYDSFLEFTCVEMNENSLIFLDTKVIENEGNLELEQYRKTKNDSTCIMNYKKSIAPFQYKNSSLNGEIYRANNCTSNDKNRDLALANLEYIFINNLYPKKMVKNKINEIKNRNFGPNPNKAIREEELNNPEIIKFFLSIPFTSFRCSGIATNLKKILSKYTPNYSLKICFKTITLQKIVLPRLKPYKPLLLTPNTVYLFTCTCSETYIGHTSRILKNRIQEHGRCENSHIFEHIHDCTDYHLALEARFHCTDPNRTQLRIQLYEHFKALKTNLTNWYDRVAYEGLMINLHQPTLHKQLKFMKCNLICSCITQIYDLYESLE